MEMNGAEFMNSRTSSMINDQDQVSEEEMMTDLRRGPWTIEEDQTLVSYVTKYGEGRWNSLARCAGLKRTGKSCRLRWLNYLRPDVRRGNITLEEQLLILELHSRFGNRWSKIAQHLPGRTDNEIKNYWRTRVQKHAKQLKCDVNSKQFKDTMRYLWMPRLVERIQAAAASSTAPTTALPHNHHLSPINDHITSTVSATNDFVLPPSVSALSHFNNTESSYATENSSGTDSFGTHASPETTTTTGTCDLQASFENSNLDHFQGGYQFGYSDTLISPNGFYNPNNGMNFQDMEQSNNYQWALNSQEEEDLSNEFWNSDDFWILQQQLDNNF